MSIASGRRRGIGYGLIENVREKQVVLVEVWQVAHYVIQVSSIPEGKPAEFHEDQYKLRFQKSNIHGKEVTWNEAETMGFSRAQKKRGSCGLHHAE